MEPIVKKVLKKIESNGFEAYLVGGYVRDLLLKRRTYDVDICTNALPKELKKIFPNAVIHNYGGISFKIKKFNFDITTYRKEIKYANRKPIEIEYINSLIEDINRRDFKINAICINSKGYFIDLCDGMLDIKKGVISTIGDSDKKFKEDPLRMLRAIRFSSILNFKLEESTLVSIERNKELIVTLSDYRIKEELDKIMTNKNVIIGLEMLKDFGILDLLNIKYTKLKYVTDPIGMWAQLEMEFNSSFTKEEKNTIINVQKILEYKKIDNNILFKYGLYQSIVAGEILGISKVTINKMFKHMPINNKSDIVVSANDIMKILKINPSEIISIIQDDLINEIINFNLKNNYNEIKKFLLARKARWVK